MSSAYGGQSTQPHPGSATSLAKPRRNSPKVACPGKGRGKIKTKTKEIRLSGRINPQVKSNERTGFGRRFA
jgi:hypothetical protein